MSETETQITYSPERDKIVAAIAAIQGEVGTIKKGSRNSQQGYNYASCDDLVEALRPLLAQHGCCITYSIVQSADIGERDTRAGNVMHRYRVKMQATVSHPSGQWASVVSIGEGEDSTDKAPYKAHTGARKYALISLFNISTDDDPERDHGAAQTAARPTPAQRPQTQTASRPAPSGGGALPPQGERTFTIIDVREATGTDKNGKPWTRYDIITAETTGGEEMRFGTFNQGQADIAQGCLDTGCLAEISFQRNGKFLNMTDIEAVEAEEEHQPPDTNDAAPLSADDIPF